MSYEEIENVFFLPVEFCKHKLIDKDGMGHLKKKRVSKTDRMLCWLDAGLPVARSRLGLFFFFSRCAFGHAWCPGQGKPYTPPAGDASGVRRLKDALTATLVGRPGRRFFFPFAVSVSFSFSFSLFFSFSFSFSLSFSFFFIFLFFLFVFFRFFFRFDFCSDSKFVPI